MERGDLERDFTWYGKVRGRNRTLRVFYSEPSLALCVSSHRQGQETGTGAGTCIGSHQLALALARNCTS